MKQKIYLIIILFFSLFLTQNAIAQNWNQIIKTVSSTRNLQTVAGRSPNDNFGRSVAIDGDYAVVGVDLEDSDENGADIRTDAGSALVFKRTAGVWTQIKKIVASDRALNDNFGFSVSISGNILVVGALFEDEDASGASTLVSAGSAYIFYKDQGGVDNWGQVKKIVASDRAQLDYFGRAVSISDDMIVVGAYQEDQDASGGNTLSGAGSAYVFHKDQGGSDNWGQVKKIVASDRGVEDRFAYTVSISGDIVVVGAYLESEDASGANTFNAAGSAYIFYKDQGGANNWGQVRKIVASDRDINDYFGSSLSVSGDIIVVGAYREDEDASGANSITSAGSAYIFYKDLGGADNWGQAIKIVPDFRNVLDEFGHSVAISGNNVLVGSYREDYDENELNLLGDAGAAYVFNKDEGGVDNWGQVKKMVAADRDAADNFGSAVAIFDTTVLVAAVYEDEDVNGGNTLSNAGSAYFFHIDEGGVNNWGQKQKVVMEDAGADQNYGYSVAVDGNYAVVAAYRDFSDETGNNHLFEAGSAYILKNLNGVWTEIKKIVASDRAASDRFGVSVSISGDIVVVGAASEDEDALGANTLFGAGAAYIFYKDQGGVDNWGQVKKIVASDRDVGDNFGVSVSISGDIVAVGANWENEDAGGTNTFNDAGSAYIFYKDQGGSNNWGQVKKIVAADRAINDNFGFAVSINANTLLVGAQSEDEDAGGINTVFNAGSAYIFYKDQGGAGNWGQVKKIVASDRDVGDFFGSSVSLDADIALVGAFSEDEDELGANTLSNAGSAYIFYKDQGGVDNWGQIKKIVASDRASLDNFSESLSISGNTIVIGAFQEDEDASGTNTVNLAGSAYIFNKDEGGVNNWGEVKKIVAADRDVFDVFGTAIAIDNGTVIVGATNQSYDAKGSSIIYRSGAAYFFKDCITTSLPTAFTSVVANQPAAVQTYYDNNCNLIATVDGGAYTIAGQTTAKVWIEAVQPSLPYTQYVKRHYEITPDNNAAAATGRITLYFTQQEFDDFNVVSNVDLPTGPLDLSGIGNMLVEQRGGRSSDGTGLPNTYSGTVTTIDPNDVLDIIWSATDLRWEVSFDVTGFSGFFIKTFAFPLPVSWLHVHANLNNQNKATINWQVQEQGATTYVVEKSINGTDFNAIGSLNSKGDGTNSYNVTEATSLIGTGFYRIKQIQKGGHFVYSSIMRLSTFTKTGITVYPNPVKDILTISIGNNLLKTKAVVADMSGKLLSTININAALFSFDMSSFEPGVYIIKFENGNYQKIIKQ